MPTPKIAGREFQLHQDLLNGKPLTNLSAEQAAALLATIYEDIAIRPECDLEKNKKLYNAVYNKCGVAEALKRELEADQDRSDRWALGDRKEALKSLSGDHAVKDVKRESAPADVALPTAVQANFEKISQKRVQVNSLTVWSCMSAPTKALPAATEEEKAVYALARGIGGLQLGQKSLADLNKQLVDFANQPSPQKLNKLKAEVAARHQTKIKQEQAEKDKRAAQQKKQRDAIKQKAQAAKEKADKLKAEQEAPRKKEEEKRKQQDAKKNPITKKPQQFQEKAPKPKPMSFPKKPPNQLPPTVPMTTIPIMTTSVPSANIAPSSTPKPSFFGKIKALFSKKGQGK